MVVKYKIIAILFLVTLVTGCVNQQPEEEVKQGLELSADPDPQAIFEGSSSSLHFDLKNNADKDYYGTTIDLFNTGIMETEGQCLHSFGLLRPGERKSHTCKVGVGKTNKQSNKLDYRAKFRTYVTATPTLKLLSEDEYQKRKTTGKLEEPGRSFSFEDENLRISVEFSEDLPIIDEEERMEYMHIDIENIGNGFVDPLPKEHIAIIDLSAGENQQIGDDQNNQDNQSSGGVLGLLESLFQLGDGETLSPDVGEVREKSIGTCDKPETLDQIGGQFTRITCALPLTGETEFMQNRELLIAVLYDYEVRGSTNINIKQKG